eukprot:TRINITY_DN7594_c0_g1_i1.p1 TRINITY_DN7594_c0_g1~~TRINITY_DN7594_c0_g1_i1.p1  ORF type:complete len:1008 (+),score=161.64 TRINITY_DN7594_c0_g1_i1:117-3026(+)
MTLSLGNFTPISVILEESSSSGEEDDVAIGQLANKHGSPANLTDSVKATQSHISNIAIIISDSSESESDTPELRPKKRRKNVARKEKPPPVATSRVKRKASQPAPKTATPDAEMSDADAPLNKSKDSRSGSDASDHESEPDDTLYSQESAVESSAVNIKPPAKKRGRIAVSEQAALKKAKEAEAAAASDDDESDNAPSSVSPASRKPERPAKPKQESRKKVEDAAATKLTAAALATAKLAGVALAPPATVASKPRPTSSKPLAPVLVSDGSVAVSPSPSPATVTPKVVSKGTPTEPLNKAAPTQQLPVVKAKPKSAVIKPAAATAASASPHQTSVQAAKIQAEQQAAIDFEQKRQRARENLLQKLRGEEEMTPRLKELATELEEAIFQRNPIVGKWSTRMRSVMFNISKNDQLRARLVSGELSVAEIAVMDNWDMAGEKLEQDRKQVLQDQDRKVLIETPVTTPIMKVTKKGLEMIEAAETAVSTPISRIDPFQPSKRTTTPTAELLFLDRLTEPSAQLATLTPMSALLATPLPTFGSLSVASEDARDAVPTDLQFDIDLETARVVVDHSMTVSDDESRAFDKSHLAPLLEDDASVGIAQTSAFMTFLCSPLVEQDVTALACVLAVEKSPPEVVRVLMDTGLMSIFATWVQRSGSKNPLLLVHLLRTLGTLPLKHEQEIRSGNIGRLVRGLTDAKSDTAPEVRQEAAKTMSLWRAWVSSRQPQPDATATATAAATTGKNASPIKLLKPSSAPIGTKVVAKASHGISLVASTKAQSEKRKAKVTVTNFVINATPGDKLAMAAKNERMIAHTAQPLDSILNAMGRTRLSLEIIPLSERKRKLRWTDEVGGSLEARREFEKDEPDSKESDQADEYESFDPQQYRTSPPPPPQLVEQALASAMTPPDTAQLSAMTASLSFYKPLVLEIAHDERKFGAESIEREVQRLRERKTLNVQYYSEAMIPHTPTEPIES